MGLLFNIKEKWAEKRLKKLAPAQRTRKGVTFSDAKKVAIVYQEAGEDRYHQVKQFIQWLKGEYGIRDIKAVAYFDNDEKLAPAYQAHKLETDYFCKSELSWSLRPNETMIKWATEAPDIMLDLSTDKCIPLSYLVKVSNAAMKVGIAGSFNQPLHDLSIAVDEQDAITDFITQTRYYLSQLELV